MREFMTCIKKISDIPPENLEGKFRANMDINKIQDRYVIVDGNNKVLSSAHGWGFKSIETAKRYAGSITFVLEGIDTRSKKKFK